MHWLWCHVAALALIVLNTHHQQAMYTTSRPHILLPGATMYCLACQQQQPHVA